MNESTLVPRKEISDLDWLARNVHVWPCGKHQPWCYVVTKVDGKRTWASNVLSSSFQYSRVDKYQWLARRAELQNKPSWKDAPEWAFCIVQDRRGNWYFCSDSPNHEDGEWLDHSVRKSVIANGGKVLGDWRDTIEKRPDMYKNKKEIDTSSECVHKTEESVHISELEMLARVSHLISDKRHRKQFTPFASVEDAATARRPEASPSSDIRSARKECEELRAEFHSDPSSHPKGHKITIMQSEGDVKHFGGIIGRSLLLEEDAATAKQPAPKGSGNPILGMVLADLTNRALEGKEKYGEPLLAHNGRNPLWDAYQEALDLAMYLRQAIEEQKQ